MSKLHGSQVWNEMLHVEKTSSWADMGYVIAEREAAFAGPGKAWGITRKTRRGGHLHPLNERANQLIAMVQAKFEDPFRAIKRQFGHVKSRYRSLAKNRANSSRCSRSESFS